MSIEEWRWIKDFEGRYQISNRGRVKSFLFSRRGRIMKLSPSEQGYMRIGLQWGNRFLVHRLVAEAFLGTWVVTQVT